MGILKDDNNGSSVNSFSFSLVIMFLISNLLHVYFWNTEKYGLNTPMGRLSLINGFQCPP